MKVIFSNRAYTSVLSETTEKIETETGGLFLGIVEDDIWYIIEAIDPGPNSIFEVAYFEYDQKYTQHLINKIANYYKEKMSLIGLWHRHPGSFDRFSSTDNGTNLKFAKMRNQGAISALVNIDPQFRITMYHVDQLCRYNKISYDVGDHLIPQKFLIYKDKLEYEKLMLSKLNGNVRIDDEYHRSVSLKSFMNLIEKSFSNLKNELEIDYPEKSLEEVKEKLIDEIIEDLDFITNELKIEVMMRQKDMNLIIIQNTIDNLTRIDFIYDEKQDRVIFRYNDINYYYEQGLFKNKYMSFLNKSNEEINDSEILEISNNDEERKNVFINSLLKMFRKK